MIGDGTDIIGAITDDNVTVGANCVAEKNSVIGYGADIGKFSRLLSGVKIWPGKTIPSESVINKDMFYETPVSLEFDIFGISGKMYSQFTLSDAVKIGQALASLKGIKRIGISCDGKNPSAVYRELLCTGVLSCGAACYDFEESYMAQAYFYSAYCGLDAFIFISANDDIINLSFFGKNGMPVSAGTARMINNNYRFSAFSFSGPDNTGILYRMAPLSTAYSCGLQKQMQVSEAAFNISVECENENVKRSLEAFFADKKPEGSEKLIQFLFNPTGTEMYCLENERFYSSDRIRSVLCELEFAEGHDVIIPENASESIEKTAVKYGRKAFRVYEGATEEYDFNKQDILENLWNFDAVFLCVKLMNLLTASGSTLEELMNMQNDFSVRSKIIELDCSPSSIRNKIVSSLRVNKNPGDIYFSVPSSKGDIKLRQMGNTSRIRMIVEAADMETAKELMTDVSGKFAGGR